MFKNNQIVHVKKMDKELKKIAKTTTPPIGWSATIRRLLNMSMAQLGKKLKLSPQSVKALEKREEEGSITLKNLKKIANVFDMDLVYTFVPRHSLEQLIAKNALKRAIAIVEESEQNMVLEAQNVSQREIKEEIKELQEILIRFIHKTIWD